MKKNRLEKRVKEGKIDLERKIQETIRILSCTHPDNTDQLRKYQKVLNNYTKEWRDKYETDYKHQR